MPRPRLRSIWANMLARCDNPGHHAYSYYGGRGITVCDRWRTFDNFCADVGEPPTPQHTLDRYPNQSGNYGPDNFRWATRKEQMRNMRGNTIVTVRGKQMTMAEALDGTGIPRNTYIYRLRRGLTPDEALEDRPIIPNRVRGRFAKGAQP